MLSSLFLFRNAGKVFREPTRIETICQSLHQASDSLQVCKKEPPNFVDEQLYDKTLGISVILNTPEIMYFNHGDLL